MGGLRSAAWGNFRGELRGLMRKGEGRNEVGGI